MLRPLQIGLNGHQLLISRLLPKCSNPRHVGVCSGQPGAQLARGTLLTDHLLLPAPAPIQLRLLQPPQGVDFGMLQDWMIPAPHTLRQAAVPSPALS